MIFFSYLKLKRKKKKEKKKKNPMKYQETIKPHYEAVRIYQTLNGIVYRPPNTLAYSLESRHLLQYKL